MKNSKEMAEIIKKRFGDYQSFEYAIIDALASGQLTQKKLINACRITNL